MSSDNNESENISKKKINNDFNNTDDHRQINKNENKQFSNNIMENEDFEKFKNN